MMPSNTHLVLIPSFNPGPIVLDVLRHARANWAPIWVVTDGSTDGTPEMLRGLAEEFSDYRVLSLPNNHGKGSAVLYGAEQALAAGFTHVLCFDSDGQHPADRIPEYMELSRQNPNAMILGKPIFGKDAPLVRVLWRQMANFWTAVLTLGGGVGDSLFGMRVYPLLPLCEAMRSTRWARRFDFEPEVAIRLIWRGLGVHNLPTRVRYLTRAEGGVSHFHYRRDNLLLTGMYFRLLLGFFQNLPKLIRRRLSGP